MKSLRTTIILLAIVAGLGGYIYFNERGPVAKSDSELLLRIEPAGIDSITLTEGEGHISLVKAGEQWQLKSERMHPVPADAAAVSRLLEQLQLLQSPASLPGTPDKLKEYGLDQPRASIEVGAARIMFGNRPPFDASQIYVRIQQGGRDTVGLIASTLGDLASKPLQEWRDKTILQISVPDVSELRITAPQLTAVFEREVENATAAEPAWKITRPVQAAAGAGVVNSFLKQLTQIKASAFLDDEPNSQAQWGLQKPLALVQITANGVTQSLRIGRRTRNGYAAQNSASPTVFEVPSALFALVNRPLGEWRSRQVLNFEIDHVTQLHINTHGRELSFKNSGNRWQLATGSTVAEAQAVHQAVLDLLLGAQGLNVREFIDQPASPSKYGLQQPSLKLTLLSSQWSGPITIALASSNRKCYGRVTGSDYRAGSVYELSPTTLEAFQPALKVLLPPR